MGTRWRLVSISLLAAALGCGGGSGGDDAWVDGHDATWPLPDVMADSGPVGPDSADPGSTDAPIGEVPTTPAGTNYVIVTDDSLAGAAGQIAAYRESTGYTVATYKVSDLIPDPVTIYDLIGPVQDVLAQAAGGLSDDETLYLLLVGDAGYGAADLDGRIPAIPCDNMIGDCYTDNVYGDLDGDRVPEAAVGRIPASTQQEVTAYLDKLKGHESSYETGLWNRRISLYTGEANFGPQIDAMLEMAVMEGLTRVSHAFDVIGGYDNPTSNYYYEPFEEKVIDLFNQGNVMVIYIGHGSDEWTQGLDASQVPKVHCQHRLPFAAFFACYAGNYVGSGDCLAEKLLKKPDGPIVTYASSDVSHPYGNAVMVYELQAVTMNVRPATVGAAILESKVRAIHNQDDFRDLIDAAALIEVPEYEQMIIKTQHLDLYNLMGDPAAAMKYPASKIAFDVPGGDVASGSIEVSGTSPGVETGKVLVTLETERDVILWDLDPVDPDDPDQAVVQANWEKANDKVVASVEAEVKSGAFDAKLSFTTDLPGGDYWIKAYAWDDTLDSFGFIAAP